MQTYTHKQTVAFCSCNISSNKLSSCFVSTTCVDNDYLKVLRFELFNSVLRNNNWIWLSITEKVFLKTTASYIWNKTAHTHTHSLSLSLSLSFSLCRILSLSLSTCRKKVFGLLRSSVWPDQKRPLWKCQHKPKKPSIPAVDSSTLAVENAVSDYK